MGVLLAVAACSSAAAPLPSDTTGPNKPPGGGSQGSTGSPQLDDPASAAPAGPSGGGNVIDPGKPTLVVPRPGQLDVHPVAIEELVARIEARRVIVNASWWSGVEPCYVLDSTAVKIDGKAITVSVREGASKRDVACIEIAMHKVTVIDLGDLDPGTYTIRPDQGSAQPIEVHVSD
jgi:hypothetical protein